MHELSIAQNVLDIVQQHVGDRRGLVRTVTLRVGAFAGVMPESLEFCFRAVAESTPLAQTGLVIETVPATIRCRACGSESSPDQPLFLCARCGSSQTDLVHGMELDVVQIELEDDHAEVS